MLSVTSVDISSLFHFPTEKLSVMRRSQPRSNLLHYCKLTVICCHTFVPSLQENNITPDVLKQSLENKLCDFALVVCKFDI